jgi:restriction system protein
MSARSYRSNAWSRLQHTHWMILLLAAGVLGSVTYVSLGYFLASYLPHSALPVPLQPSAAHQHTFRLAGALLWVFFGVLWAVRSWRYHRYRRQLLHRAHRLADIQNLSWQDFELLVGQMYRRHGYHVTEAGLGGADGGIDLIAQKWGSGEKIVVQCKHYKSTSVGVPVVRELYGLMVHHKATGAAVVCCGHFTPAAYAFAQDKPLTLVGADKLLLGLAKIRKS